MNIKKFIKENKKETIATAIILVNLAIIKKDLTQIKQMKEGGRIHLF